MRRPLLYVIPIIHSEADLGSLATHARQHTSDRAWAEKQAAVKAFWSRVQAWCSSLPKQLATFRLYQDGLPVCGREREIVTELASQNSANHALLLELIARGAMLEGTESGPLLLEEYELARRAIAQKQPDPAKAADLLEARDRFIAERIAQTLGAGETGLLFIGALHNVLTKLPPAIDVQRVRLG